MDIDEKKAKISRKLLKFDKIFVPQTPKSTAKARASFVANCAAGGTVPRKYKKLVSENVHATRVNFSRKWIALKTRRTVNDFDQRSKLHSY